MTQFLGTHQNRLDAKGRVSVPAPFRAALRDGAEAAGGIVLRPSFNHPCIEAWPANEFQALAAPLNRLDLFSEEHDDLASKVEFARGCSVVGLDQVDDGQIGKAGITEGRVAE